MAILEKLFLEHVTFMVQKIKKNCELNGSVEVALKQLIDRDENLSRAHKIGGSFRERTREKGFRTLILLIIEQQLSLASAAAIMGRISEKIVPLTPKMFLSLHEEELRKLGLSARKIEYCYELSRAIENGSLNLEGLENLTEAAAIAELVKIKGIGPWTAEVYLMTALGRLDVFPAGDLALQVAVQNLYGLPQKPSVKVLAELSALWRPYRSVAARILWQYYGTIKKNSKIP